MSAQFDKQIKMLHIYSLDFEICRTSHQFCSILHVDEHHAGAPSLFLQPTSKAIRLKALLLPLFVEQTTKHGYKSVLPKIYLHKPRLMYHSLQAVPQYKLQTGQTDKSLQGNK